MTPGHLGAWKGSPNNPERNFTGLVDELEIIMEHQTETPIRQTPDLKVFRNQENYQEVKQVAMR